MHELARKQGRIGTLVAGPPSHAICHSEGIGSQEIGVFAHLDAQTGFLPLARDATADPRRSRRRSRRRCWPVFRYPVRTVLEYVSDMENDRQHQT
jgi:hypothetical protein